MNIKSPHLPRFQFQQSAGAPLSGLSGWKDLEPKYEEYSISYEEMHDESFAPNRSHTCLFSPLTMWLVSIVDQQF